MSARATPKTQKAPLQNSAIQKGTKFPLHEPRDWPVTLLLPGQESFELLGHNLIQHGRFRMAGKVFRCSIQHVPAGGRRQTNRVDDSKGFNGQPP